MKRKEREWERETVRVQIKEKVKTAKTFLWHENDNVFRVETSVYCISTVEHIAWALHSDILNETQNITSFGKVINRMHTH